MDTLILVVDRVDEVGAAYVVEGISHLRTGEFRKEIWITRQQSGWEIEMPKMWVKSV